MAANAAHSGSDAAVISDSDMMQILLVGTGWLGSSEKLIVESRTRRLLSIRHWNQAHPAARNTWIKHRVLVAEIRSSGMPAQTKAIANVLSGEKPSSTLLPGGSEKSLLSQQN